MPTAETPQKDRRERAAEPLGGGYHPGQKWAGVTPSASEKQKNPPFPKIYICQEGKRMKETDKTYTETKYKLRDELHEKIDKIFEIVDGEHTRELTITSRISLGHVQVEYEIKGGNITNI